MTNNRLAVIDLGTNTFNLLVAEPLGRSFDVLHQEQFGVKIGQGGISKGLITEEAQKRLFKAVTQINRTIRLYKVPEFKAYGVATSVFRSTRNGKEIVSEIKRQAGLNIDIISGDREAELIYYGVKSALDIGEENVLMMDIGGGSVEFIICNYRKIHWKKSFEIGAQRLMDQFLKSDPVSELDLMRLEIFLEAKLYELSNAVFRYSPKYLIGSAGAFETLSTLAYSMEKTGDLNSFMDRNYQLKVKEYTIGPDVFNDVYQLIVRNDRESRLAIPGLMPLRADMIVMALALLRFILEKYDLEKIRVSAYALKEGYLMSRLNRN